MDQRSHKSQKSLGLTERPSTIETLPPPTLAPSPVKVLVVDASPIILKRLVNLVADVPNVNVVGEATDGLRAQELFRHFRPDVIILDIQIPRIDGLDLLVLFKREHPACKVVVLTTYEFEAFRRLYAQLGADHFFTKSMEFEQIIEVLDGVRHRSLPGPRTDES